MTRVPTGSHFWTYFGMTPQRHPNIRKPLCILLIPNAKLKLVLLCVLILGFMFGIQLELIFMLFVIFMLFQILENL